jgi:bacterioferritin
MVGWLPYLTCLVNRDAMVRKDTWGGASLRRCDRSRKIRSSCANCVTLAFSPGVIGMKGSPRVIEELNKALREELTAINQYFLHAEMCENWGYEKLSEYIKKQSIGEMKHAEALMERILFLDGSPSMQPLELTVGKNVQEMLQSDLNLELGAVKDYNAAIQVAVAEKDNGSRDLFVMLLKDEEGHVDWLEAQMHLIEELGYERYLTMQMGEDKEE